MNVADTKLLTWFQNSSFGIFHIDSCLRMMCLKLTEDKHAYNELRDMRIAVNSPDYDETEVLLKPPKAQGEEESDSWFEANKIFDGIILVAIILSSLMLPLDNPLNDPNAE